MKEERGKESQREVISISTESDLCQKPGHVVINQISAIAYRNIKQILYRTVPLVDLDLELVID